MTYVGYTHNIHANFLMLNLLNQTRLLVEVDLILDPNILLVRSHTQYIYLINKVYKYAKARDEHIKGRMFIPCHGHGRCRGYRELTW